MVSCELSCMVVYCLLIVLPGCDINMHDGTNYYSQSKTKQHLVEFQSIRRYVKLICCQGSIPLSRPSVMLAFCLIAFIFVGKFPVQTSNGNVVAFWLCVYSRSNNSRVIGFQFGVICAKIAI